MRLAQSFEVKAPVEEVWAALIDVERVAPCLPGATITGGGKGGVYDGSFTVKIGPTTASYTGKLEMVDVDAALRTATMRADGTDKRGQGGAKAMIVSRVEPAGAGSRVAVDTDYTITGRLARFGRSGMIEDISERLLREFASRLQASLEGPEAPAVSSEDPGSEADTQATDEMDAVRMVSEPLDAGSPVSEPLDAGSRVNEPLDAGSLAAEVALDRFRANPLPVLAGLLGLVLLLRRLGRRGGGD